jgi:hypothetical protein
MNRTVSACLAASLRLVFALFILLAGWGFGSAPLAQDSTGVLIITSDPEGQPAFVDDAPVGYTPIVHTLPVGPHRIRLPHPDRLDWAARDRERDIRLAAGDTVRIHMVFVGPVTVLSDPFDAEVYVDGQRAGTTPIRLPDLSPGIHTLSIRKNGYLEALRPIVVQDTSRQTVSVVLAPSEPVRMAVSAEGYSRRSGRLHKIIGYTTLGLGALFSGMALHASHQADLAYRDYLNTADPVQLERAFQRAARYDTRTSRYVVIAQVNFTTSFYFFITHVFKSDAAGRRGRE